MKQLSALFILLLFTIGHTTVYAQSEKVADSLGLPGDNLNLYAVMKIFQESETLEKFEQKLNTEDSRINNLDLNNDDKVDYIRVIDNVDGNTHNIVLQVPINEKENQDVAYFIVDKNEKGEVQIQLIGDEDLYGKDYVVEPNYTDAEKKEETPNPGYVNKSTQNNTGSNSQSKTTINNYYTTYQTASWPIISYMFAPNYVIWVSPWRWYYYPSYWTAWTPWYWHRYYGYHYYWHSYYYRNYRYCRYYRNPYARNHYYGRRSTSVSISIFIKSGNYRKTYSHPEGKRTGKMDYYKDNRNRKSSIVKKSPVERPTEKRHMIKRETSKNDIQFHNNRTEKQQSQRRNDPPKPEKRIDNNKPEKSHIEKSNADHGSKRSHGKH